MFLELRVVEVHSAASSRWRYKMAFERAITAHWRSATVYLLQAWTMPPRLINRADL